MKAAVFASEDTSKPTDWWDAMNGAQPWKMYVSVGPNGNPNSPPPRVWPGYVAQFDIIVKDFRVRTEDRVGLHDLGLRQRGFR